MVVLIKMIKKIIERFLSIFKREGTTSEKELPETEHKPELHTNLPSINPIKTSHKSSVTQNLLKERLKEDNILLLGHLVSKDEGKSNLKIPGIPNFNTISDVLEYFEKEYKIKKSKLANFASFSSKTNQFYIERKILQKSSKIGNKARYIYIPKPFVKFVQKVILKDILEKVETPPQLVGFTKNKSIKDAVVSHVKKDVVLILDIEKFFQNTTAKKVFNIFKNIGYSREVSLFLTALTTTKVKVENKKGFKGKRALPTGSPTSPYLSKLALIDFVAELNELIKKWQNMPIKDVDFSVYADNIIISFNTENKEKRKEISKGIIENLQELLKKHGYKLNKEKTKILTKKKKVLGLVINEKINIDRNYYRKLRAEIHNLWKNKKQLGKSSFDEKLIQKIRGKLNYLKLINPSKYNSLFIKYSTHLEELF